MKRTVNILLLALLAFTSCRKKLIETVQPTISPITEAVFAAGHIEATNQFTLTALNDGYIKNVLATEGDAVKSGQTIFEQDNAAAAIQENTATKNLQISQQQATASSATLQQLKAQLISASQKLQNDKAQLERMHRLYTTNSVAKVEVDNAQLAYDNSINSVAGIQQNVEATKLTLQQTVVTNQGQQQTAITNAGYFNIKAPGSYKVFSLLKKKGELVRKGDAVAVLGSGNAQTIVLDIDETSIAKIKLQQKVLVELNTQKGKTLIASISKIYPVFDGASQSYKVEAVFDSMQTQVINGTLLQANIIVAKKDKALLIPRACLAANNKVMLLHDQKTDTVTVQTGIISTDWVEIVSGLTTGDHLIKAY